MEEYTFFFFFFLSKSSPERCRSKESVGKLLIQFGVSSSFSSTPYCVGSKDPPCSLDSHAINPCSRC